MKLVRLTEFSFILTSSHKRVTKLVNTQSDMCLTTQNWMSPCTSCNVTLLNISGSGTASVWSAQWEYHVECVTSDPVTRRRATQTSSPWLSALFNGVLGISGGPSQKQRLPYFFKVTLLHGNQTMLWLLQKVSLTK